MSSKFDIPGRAAVSYEMPGKESVSAEATLERIWSGLSVIRILERSASCDLDIFAVGSVKDMMRRTGASWG